jgi:hypothetical protein
MEIILEVVFHPRNAKSELGDLDLILVGLIVYL